MMNKKNKSKANFKISNIKIIDMLFLALFILVNQSFAFAQTASILPQAKTQFLDSNGKPLVSGTVTSYIPGTTTPKTTWQDAAETIPNTNPLTLDSAGRALLLGSGSYRQIVKDRLNNIIWDQVTSSIGSGGGGGSTATGDGDLVGTIKPWAGMTAPNQYAFTYGQEVSRVTFASLFTAITSTQAAFCTSGSPIVSGIGDTTNFWIGMSVEIPCVGAGFSTIISKTSSSVTLAVNANTNLTTTAIFFPWGRGNGTTTFNVPDFRGLIPAGNNIMGGVASSNMTAAFFGAADPNSSGGQGGGQSTALGLTNLPTGITSSNPNTIALVVVTNRVVTDNTGSAVGGGTITAVGTTSSAITSNGTIGIGGAAVVSTNTGSGGSAVAFSRIPPTKTVNYIIKTTPDLNSATASGVTSLGGMTGSIACGTGLLCTGNNISVNTISFTSVSGSASAAQLGAAPASHASLNDVAGIPTWVTVPNCIDNVGQHINYTQSTDLWSCGTSASATGVDSVELFFNKTVQVDQTWEGGTAFCDGSNNPHTGASQATETYGPDQYRLGCDTGTGRFTSAQVTSASVGNPVPGVTNYLHLVVTTADASATATNNYHLEIPVEGPRVAPLKYGTASAVSLTCQFIFSSSINGTYSVTAVEGNANTLSQVATFAYAGGGGAAAVSFTYTPFTTGTWVLTPGQFSFKLIFDLGSGSNFETASTFTPIAGLKIRTPGSVKFIATNGAVINISAVQCDPGTTLLPFRFKSYQQDLADAQYFYYKTFPRGTAVAQNAGVTGAIGYNVHTAGATKDSVMAIWPKMPNAPTLYSFNPSAANAKWRNNDLTADSGTPAFNVIGTSSALISNPQVVGDALSNFEFLQLAVDGRLGGF